ncbi:MAG: carboxymuconolactone decarboxylase family protein [Candidatus Cloacimonetes bacterium]|nr:carboxymuconolactone decarboxylase family protein [Candidatus Cloacimonadota bacterium]
MSHIKMIDEEKATGKLKEVYESIAGRGRKMAHILKVQSLNPEAMKAHYQFYRSIIFGKSDLTRTQREMIATVVSVENGCFY